MIWLKSETVKITSNTPTRPCTQMTDENVPTNSQFKHGDGDELTLTNQNGLT